MSWYKTGTVNVTNGSATVTGVGTAFVANVKVGEEFRLQGANAGYEVTAVVSDTQLTIAPAYLGTTQTGQAYHIVPVKGFLKGAYDALNNVLAQWDSYLSGALAGRFGDGSVGAPGISFLGDINTGLYRPAADQIGAATNGIRRWLLSNTAFQVDVPITGTAVQSGPADATAGRVLLTGASATVLSASPALRMASGGTANAVTVTTGAALATVQTGMRVRFRAAAANTGAATIKVDAAAAAAAVTVTGAALPAGYIRTDMDTIAEWTGTAWRVYRDPERGANANGNYVRHANGHQECWHSISAGDTKALGTGAYSDPFRSAALSWTFPAAFSAAPAFAASCITDAAGPARGHAAVTRFAPSTTAQGDIQIYRLSSADTDSATVPTTLTMRATGYWY